MTHSAIVFFLIAAAAPAQNPGEFGTLDLSGIRGLTVQHDGRWMPLDTVARDIVSKISESEFFDGKDPVHWLLEWTFDPQAGMAQPVITLANAELRRELRLSPTQTVFSFNELANHEPLRELIDALAHRSRQGKLDPLESKVVEIRGRLLTLRDVFAGDVINMIPDPDDAFGAWMPVPHAGHPTGSQPLASAWKALGDAFLANDSAAFNEASARVSAEAAALPAAHRPDPARIATELRYNILNPFRKSWMIMSGGALLALIAMLAKRKWIDGLAILALIAGFATISYGLSLRWVIAGRIPAANMYESLLFLGWGMGAFAIIAMLALHHRSVPLTASVMGALSLFLADILPLDPMVRTIVPVLRDTVWMSIHVPIIMVSYSVLALAALLAHVQLVVMALIPHRKDYARSIDSLHYWHIHVGSLLLLAGIMTGSMWGASSWGRYWGWDPKEVWSLIAFVGYLAILHVRVDHSRVPRGGFVIASVVVAAVFVIIANKMSPLTPWRLAACGGTCAAVMFFVLARGPLATAIKSIACFWLIIMTYLGVNYVLGTGLHSYGFGTGAMTKWLFLIGEIDLGLIALLAIIYLAGRRAKPLESVAATP